MPKRIPDIEFPFIHSRTLRARFDEAPISTDGGAVLLRHIDHRLSLIRSLAAAIPDRRDLRYIEHTVAEQMGQRVFGIALGYEDCNDAQTLRGDPLLKVCCGRELTAASLASQPTLSRFENEATAQSCYRFGSRSARVLLRAASLQAAAANRARSRSIG